MIGELAILVAGTWACVTLVNWVLEAFRDPSRATACRPVEALEALARDRGGRVLGDTFEGRLLDRAVRVTARGIAFHVEVEVFPGVAQGRPDGSVDDLLRVFRAHEVRFRRGALEAWVDFGGGVLGARAEADRLARLLDRLVDLAEAAGGPRVRARALAAGRCPYCHDGVDETAAGVTSCPRCGAVHHADCWTEHGRCAVYACAEAPRVLSARSF